MVGYPVGYHSGQAGAFRKAIQKMYPRIFPGEEQVSWDTHPPTLISHWLRAVTRSVNPPTLPACHEGGERWLQLPKKAIRLRDTGPDRQDPASGHRNVKRQEDVGRAPTVSATHAKGALPKQMASQEPDSTQQCKISLNCISAQFRVARFNQNQGQKESVILGTYCCCLSKIHT